MLTNIILFFLFLFQFCLGMLYQSDIPVNFSNDEAMHIFIFSLIIFSVLTIFQKNKNYKSSLIISLIFLILWIMNAMNARGSVTSINITGLISSAICLIFCLDKICKKKDI